MLGIYIHIPFCLRRCNYCDFCSSVAPPEKLRDYTAALIRNISSYKNRGLRADTVYFGGGTPSLLPADCMESIMSELRRAFVLEPDAEITTEANPGTVTSEKLDAYRKSGINRISFGIQSCKDNELYTLGRLHSFAEAADAVRIAKSVGITNVSCDLMIGIPLQTQATLAESVDALCSLGISHVSAYMLKVEEGTAFECDSIRKLLPDDDTVAQMYLMTVEMLRERGFMQYEISNFSKPCLESRHNLKYWTGEPYIGFGPSAHSYFEGRRFYVPEDIDSFIMAENQQTLTEDPAPDPLEEYIMLGLRLRKGISLDRVSALGGDVNKMLKIAHTLEKAKYLTITEDRISLTSEGFLVSNGIITRFI